MFNAEHKLRHLPFFEEVGSLNEGDPKANAVTAGLLVLRLVDSWLEDGPIADDGWSLRGVDAAVEAIDHGTPVRAILGRVLEALQVQKPDIHVVVTPLMAYGQALEYDAKWRLAADVYESLLRHLHPVEDSDAAVAAHLRLGSCYRNLSMYDDALETFSAASEIATRTADMVGVLRARIGEGRIAILRGNLPRAEEILDETISRAEGPALRDVRSRALHDRSEIARLRENYELAIQLAYRALDIQESQAERDRILSDIAAAFASLGVYSAARDAYMVLSVSAQEQYVRWVSTLNLLDISTSTGDQLRFEQYRRELRAAPLPPYLATVLEINLGQGYQRFGEREEAALHLRQAASLAREHSLNRLLFVAEDAIGSLSVPMPPQRVEAKVPLDVEEVAVAIRQMRESVGAH